MKNSNPVKIKNTQTLNGTSVVEGKFILIPIDQKKDPFGSGAPNYFIISETEKIKIGDKWLDDKGEVLSSEKQDTIDIINRTPQSEKSWFKIIVLPENFSPELIKDIVDGKLKNEDKVLVKCVAVPTENDNPMSNPEGINTEDSEYEIQFNKQNYISLYSIEEHKKKELKSLFRSYFEGVGEFFDPINPVSISLMGITDIQFEFKPDVIEMTITLERPGYLIGKGGSTIDGITEWLSRNSTPVKIKILESKLWK